VTPFELGKFFAKWVVPPAKNAVVGAAIAVLGHRVTGYPAAGLAGAVVFVAYQMIGQWRRLVVLSRQEVEMVMRCRTCGGEASMKEFIDDIPHCACGKPLLPKM
jgi:hypothetical protein